MTKQIHVCDICGNEVPKQETVHFGVNVVGELIFPFTYNSFLRQKTVQVDICRECLEKKGFSIGPGASEAQKEKINEETIKDKLLDILADIGIEPRED